MPCVSQLCCCALVFVLKIWASCAFLCRFFGVSAITWAQTDYGSVRVVNTAFGKGVMAWTNFEAPAGKKLGSYGGLKFLTSAEYKASPWADHGVEWSRVLTAVPDCPVCGQRTRKPLPSSKTSGTKRRRTEFLFTTTSSVPNAARDCPRPSCAFITFMIARVPSKIERRRWKTIRPSSSAA
jgi:hypothetical protein